MSAAAPLKKRDVVVDAQGNHFAVLDAPKDDGTVEIESVVTKRVYLAPVADLTVCPGLVAS